MPVSFRISGKPITYELAQDDESDFIRKIQEARKTSKFCNSLLACQREIELLSAHHLRLNKGQRCVMLGQEHWICGGFNVCIPVVVYGTDGSVLQKVVMRCPMAHKLAEAAYPGTVDEKMRCEVATYAYIQDNHTKIPIVHLYGFGFPDGCKFTHSQPLPFYHRLVRQIRRYVCGILRWPVPSQYVDHPNTHSLNSGYILLEYVESTTGSMLSNTLSQVMDDPTRRVNLFRGLANITLSLSQETWPQIGSLTFYNNATIGLKNRPLPCNVVIFENNGAERVISSDQTFDTVEPFISSLFAYQNNRFLQQPNAVIDEDDCRAQMAVASMMRAISHHFFGSKLRQGPYRLFLTDNNPHNIFIDEKGNITRIIDLEWVSSLPMQMAGAPHWFTGKGIDQLHGKSLDDYNEIRTEYMRIFEEEERNSGRDASLSQSMKSNWNDGTYWFVECLTSLDAMYNIFDKHIRPMYSPSVLTKRVDNAVSNFFLRGVDGLVHQKVTEKGVYDVELKKLFDSD